MRGISSKREPDRFSPAGPVALALALLALTVFATCAWAAGGSLDHSFSGDGRQTTAFGKGASQDFGNAVAIQTDGKIVVVGDSDQNASNNDNFDFALARYNPNGSLDHTFSHDGRKTTTFGDGVTWDTATAVAMQTDGKIVVAGWTERNGNTGIDFALARYNPDGSLDDSFSGDGRKTTAFGNGAGADIAKGVAIQSDGRIVVAGYSDQGPATYDDFALARYNPDGSLDHSFSGDGRQTTAFGDKASPDFGEDVAIQTDGKIVVAGWTNQDGSTGTDFALARYNPDGSLDDSFSGDGRKTTAFARGSGVDAANAVTMQADGKIVVAGYADSGPKTGSDFALARYDPNGNLDHNFAGDGRRTTAFADGAGGDFASGVAIQADGRIVAAGYSGQGSAGRVFALARYNPDGSLDHSFSGDGRQTTAFRDGCGDCFANGVAIQGDGRIVVAGSYQGWAITGTDFAVARYLP